MGAGGCSSSVEESTFPSGPFIKYVRSEMGGGIQKNARKRTREGELFKERAYAHINFKR